jgi:hypothetical protein
MFRWQTLVLAFGCTGCAMAGLATADAPTGDDDDSTIDAPSGRADAPGRPDAHTTDGSSSGCAMTFTGVVATWNLSSATGDQTSTPASSMAPGGTATAISRSAGLTAVAGAGSINASNWPTGMLDPTKYFTVSITPPNGCTLALTSATIDAKASASGPASGAIATSADSFGQDGTISTSSPSTPALTVTGQSGAVEVRIYGYAATSAQGTLRVQNTLSLAGRFD